MSLDTATVIPLNWDQIRCHPSGVKFSTNTPRQGDVCIEDIAHSLSMQACYPMTRGEFYSLAERAVLTARAMTNETRRQMSRVSTPEERLAGLLWSAPDAYLGYLPTHAASVGRTSRRILREERVRDAVFGAMALPRDAYLFGHLRTAEQSVIAAEQDDPTFGTMRTPATARRMFLNEFSVLTRERNLHG